MRGRALAMGSALAMALAGCSAGAQEGNAHRATAQRAFEVGAFRSISLAGSPEVIVTVGGAPSVRAEGDSRMIERLEIRVEDGDLRIGYRQRSSWSFGRHGNVTVHVTVPALAAATVTGSGDMRIDRVQSDRFAATVTGSGGLDLGRVEAGETSFSVTGSGGIRAVGRAQRAHIELNGSGDVDLGALEIRDATVSVHGSGDVTAKAMQAARVTLMGSGDVSITGPARCQVEKRGSGDVRCGAHG